MSYLTVLGGSRTTPLKTPTSDRDLFVIADTESLSPDLQRRYIDTDIEFRNTRWVWNTCNSLRSFTPSPNVQMPQFNYYDLRFLARVALGIPIEGDQGLREPILNIKDALRKALTQSNATSYFVIFQDLVGCRKIGRHEIASLQCGELAQRAGTQAILNIGLHDPSPKWGIPQCLASQDKLVQRNANILQSIFALKYSVSISDWVSLVMTMSNAIIAASLLDGSFSSSIVPTDEGMDLLHSDLCLIGVRPYHVLINALSHSHHVCNSSYLAALANFSVDNLTLSSNENTRN
jgi:hypothetical protein